MVQYMLQTAGIRNACTVDGPLKYTAPQRNLKYFVVQSRVTNVQTVTVALVA